MTTIDQLSIASQNINEALGRLILLPGSDTIRDLLINAGNNVDDAINELLEVDA